MFALKASGNRHYQNDEHEPEENVRCKIRLMSNMPVLFALMLSESLSSVFDDDHIRVSWGQLHVVHFYGPINLLGSQLPVFHLQKDGFFGNIPFHPNVFLVLWLFFCQLLQLLVTRVDVLIVSFCRMVMFLLKVKSIENNEEHCCSIDAVSDIVVLWILSPFFYPKFFSAPFFHFCIFQQFWVFHASLSTFQKRSIFFFLPFFTLNRTQCHQVYKSLCLPCIL